MFNHSLGDAFIDLEKELVRLKTSRDYRIKEGPAASIQEQTVQAGTVLRQCKASLQSST